MTNPKNVCVLGATFSFALAYCCEGAQTIHEDFTFMCIFHYLMKAFQLRNNVCVCLQHKIANPFVYLNGPH